MDTKMANANSNSSQPFFNNYTKALPGIPKIPLPLPGRKSSEYAYTLSRYAGIKINEHSDNAIDLDKASVDFATVFMSSPDQLNRKPDDNLSASHSNIFRQLNEGKSLAMIKADLEKRIKKIKTDLKYVNVIKSAEQSNGDDVNENASVEDLKNRFTTLEKEIAVIKNQRANAEREKTDAENSDADYKDNVSDDDRDIGQTKTVKPLKPNTTKPVKAMTKVTKKQSPTTVKTSDKSGVDGPKKTNQGAKTVAVGPMKETPPAKTAAVAGSNKIPAATKPKTGNTFQPSSPEMVGPPYNPEAEPDEEYPPDEFPVDNSGSTVTIPGIKIPARAIGKGLKRGFKGIKGTIKRNKKEKTNDQKRDKPEEKVKKEEKNPAASGTRAPATKKVPARPPGTVKTSVKVSSATGPKKGPSVTSKKTATKNVPAKPPGKVTKKTTGAKKGTVTKVPGSKVTNTKPKLPSTTAKKGTITKAPGSKVTNTKPKLPSTTAKKGTVTKAPGSKVIKTKPKLPSTKQPKGTKKTKTKSPKKPKVTKQKTTKSPKKSNVKKPKKAKDKKPKKEKKKK